MTALCVPITDTVTVCTTLTQAAPVLAVGYIFIVLYDGSLVANVTVVDDEAVTRLGSATTAGA